MILINGLETNHIGINDRGFQYGDGLFETIEIQGGKPIFLDQHLVRLAEGCIKLNIPKPDRSLLADEIFQCCKQAKQAVLKIIITRGKGGRGYRLPETIQPTRVISLHPFPDYPKSYQDEGIVSRFCETRLGLNPALAGIKHLNRLEQVMARAEWDDPVVQEGIMLDINNQIIEGTMTNLFYVRDGITHTAALKFSGVAGVVRGIIIQIANRNNIALTQHDYGKEALLNADEVFVCNSIIGIWPVKKIGEVTFPVGNITRQFQIWLAQSKA